MINRYNHDEVDAIVDLAERLGVEHVAFNRYIGPAQPEIEAEPRDLRAAFRRIERLYRDGRPVRFGNGIPQCFVRNHSEGCLAGVAYVSVDPWGGVHPCPRSSANIGSLHEASMSDLWHDKRMTEWRESTQSDCTECAAYAACHGGCQVMQEVRANKRDPLCGRPLKRYLASTVVCELPAEARPYANFHVRPEEFGVVVLGRGQAVPIQAEGLQVIEACDGGATLRDSLIGSGCRGWIYSAACGSLTCWISVSGLAA